jgi:7,8-dihydro-6-hydroxymethylpterin-pyrophosphokinase
MNHYIKEISLNSNITQAWENLKTATDVLKNRKKILAVRRLRFWNRD